VLNIIQPKSSIFPDITLKKTGHLEGKNMVKIENIAMLSDTKTTTKQIPLFEEEEDGNLIPYIDED
jgi:hypothetical protein